MNLRRTIKRFKSLYGGKKKRTRIELPEERDAKALRSEARRMGMSVPGLIKKKSQMESDIWSGLRTAGKKRNAAMAWFSKHKLSRRIGIMKKKPKEDYSPGSGRYFRG